MHEPRCNSVAFVRPDGKVLVAGGFDRGRSLATTELFDPESGTWSRGPSMSAGRNSAAAAVLKDGRFLIAGGNAESSTLSSTEIYDPRSGRWSDAAPMSTPRYCHTMTTLPDGRVLAAGGATGRAPTPSAEVYDPRTDAWTPTTDMRDAHGSGAAALLAGKVVVVGGSGPNGAVTLTDVFDPATSYWAAGPDMTSARVHLAMVTLGGDRLFVVGGGPSGYPAPATADAETLGKFQVTATLPRAIVATVPDNHSPSINAAPTHATPTVRYSSKSPDHPHDFALIVGVGNYKNLPAADYATNDARDMAGALGALGVPEENVVVLTDAKATLSEVSKYVEEWLPRRVSKDSRVYFYFSGHGAPDVKDGSAYLMPWDGDAAFVKSTGFPLTRLYAALSDLPVTRVVAMIDSCFSGAGGRSVLVAGVRPLVTVQLPKVSSPKISVLTASESEEIAGSFPERGHGLFSYYVLQGLSGSAKPEGSEHLTLEELYGYVHKHVIIDARRQNREQTPTMVSPNPKLRLY